MKRTLTIFTLVFTVMFSSASFAGWTKVAESVKGNTFYVDFERIRKPFLTLWECNECEVCDWFSDGDEEKHKELQELIKKYFYKKT